MDDLKKMIEELQDKIILQQREIDSLKKKKKNTAKNEETQLIRKAFLEGYVQRFKHEYPVWGAKENSQIKQLLSGVGLKKAIWLIQWYFQWTEPFVVRSGHTLGLLISNIVKMEAQLRRRGRYFDDVASANLSRKMILEKLQNEKGVEAYAELKSRQRYDSQVNFGSNGELPELPESEIPGVGDGLDSQSSLLDRGSGEET